MSKTDKPKMPKRVPAHETGDRGIAYLQSFITHIGWTIEEIGKDYGVDAKIEAFSDGEALGFIFFAQSKSTAGIPPENGKIVEYFDESEFNYLVQLNIPVLVTHFSVIERKMFFRWVIGPLSFSKLDKSYKLVFENDDYIDFQEPQKFIDSVMVVREIQKFKEGNLLSIDFSGKIKDRLEISSIFDLFAEKFDAKLVFGDSLLKITIEDSSLKFNSYGIFRFSQNYSSKIDLQDCICNLFIYISDIINEPRIKYSSNLFKIYLNDVLDFDAIHAANAVFDRRFNHEKLILHLENDFKKAEENDLSKCVDFLQLRYFDLSKAVRQGLTNLIGQQYKRKPNQITQYNYLSILQAGKDKLLIEIIINYQNNLEDSVFPDHLLIEVANAALRISRPDISIVFLEKIVKSSSEEIYLKAAANLQFGEYETAFIYYEKLAEITKKPFANLVLRTFLSLVVNCFGVKSQKLNYLEPKIELIDINSMEKAIEYLKEVDATHPLVWHVFANKSTEDHPNLQELEFYSAFSAILGHGDLTCKIALFKLISRIFYENKNDKDIFQFVLITVIEDIIKVREWEFINEVILWLAENGIDEPVLDKIYEIMLKVKNYHIEISAKNFLILSEDGFFGNSLFRNSILDSDEI